VCMPANDGVTQRGSKARKYFVPYFVRGEVDLKGRKNRSLRARFELFWSSYRLPEGTVDKQEFLKVHRALAGILNKHSLLYKQEVLAAYKRSLRRSAKHGLDDIRSMLSFVKFGTKFQHQRSPWSTTIKTLKDFPLGPFWGVSPTEKKSGDPTDRPVLFTISDTPRPEELKIDPYGAKIQIGKETSYFPIEPTHPTGGIVTPAGTLEAPRGSPFAKNLKEAFYTRQGVHPSDVARAPEVFSGAKGLRDSLEETEADVEASLKQLQFLRGMGFRR